MGTDRKETDEEKKSERKFTENATKGRFTRDLKFWRGTQCVFYGTSSFHTLDIKTKEVKMLQEFPDEYPAVFTVSANGLIIAGNANKLFIIQDDKHYDTVPISTAKFASLTAITTFGDGYVAGAIHRAGSDELFVLDLKSKKMQSQSFAAGTSIADITVIPESATRFKLLTAHYAMGLFRCVVDLEKEKWLSPISPVITGRRVDLCCFYPGKNLLHVSGSDLMGNNYLKIFDVNQKWQSDKPLFECFDLAADQVVFPYSSDGYCFYVNKNNQVMMINEGREVVFAQLADEMDQRLIMLPDDKLMVFQGYSSDHFRIYKTDAYLRNHAYQKILSEFLLRLQFPDKSALAASKDASHVIASYLGVFDVKSKTVKASDDDRVLLVMSIERFMKTLPAADADLPVLSKLLEMLRSKEKTVLQGAAELLQEIRKPQTTLRPSHGLKQLIKTIQYVFAPPEAKAFASIKPLGKSGD